MNETMDRLAEAQLAGNTKESSQLLGSKLLQTDQLTDQLVFFGILLFFNACRVSGLRLHEFLNLIN